MKNNAQKTTESIERQITRFAPDFRDCILARSVSSPAALERWNPNLIGSDIWGYDGYPTASLPSHALTLSQTAVQPLFLRSILHLLVEVSTESAGIMPPQRRLRILLLDLQLARHPS